MRTTKSRVKGLMYGFAAILLSFGFVLPNVNIAAADDQELHSILFDDSCTAVSTNPVDGITCTVDDVEYTIMLGTINEDGGFSNYGAEDLTAVTIHGNGKAFSFSADDVFVNGYMHLYGNDLVVTPYADGEALRFSAGNLALADIDGAVFGLYEYEEPEHGDDGGEGYVSHQSIVWSYGSGAYDISNGTITLVSVCEPAWAYDDDAAEGEFMDCVQIDGDVSLEAYDVHQGEDGGELRIERGIKLNFAVTPDEGYEFSNINIVTEPSEALDQLQDEGIDGGFSIVMPENVDIRFVAYFTSTADGAIPVDPCLGDSCGESLPVLKSAEAEDAPEDVRISIDWGEDDEDVYYLFTTDVYGDVEEFEEYLENLYGSEEISVPEIIAKMMEKFSQIALTNFDIHLIDENTGETVEYNGDGITVTFAMSNELQYIIAALDEYYDGEYELLMAHIKADGTIEHVPLTANEDGTFSFTVTSLSPFAVVAKAAATNPESVDDNGNPATYDNIVSYIVISIVAMIGLVVSGYTIRKELKK